MARKKLTSTACRSFMDRFNSSKLTVAQFCRKEKISLPTFYNRRKKALLSGVENESPLALKFLPLNAPTVLEKQSPTNRFRISLTGGTILTVPMQFDTESTSALLHILKEQGF
jgi:hypothetical protein